MENSFSLSLFSFALATPQSVTHKEIASLLFDKWIVEENAETNDKMLVVNFIMLNDYSAESNRSIYFEFSRFKASFQPFFESYIHSIICDANFSWLKWIFGRFVFIEMHSSWNNFKNLKWTKIQINKHHKFGIGLCER